ncbi:MAG TPA: DegT/DnrJ/EryC1/StrS family aminotransferase [Chryseosolibacter sp.]|nr:DegT/DnrJ/EryC1/StrS family aminotransferase [Chryseosolibacter sp.]
MTPHPLPKIPFFSLQRQHAMIENELIDVMRQVTDRNWFVLGEELKNFEANYAAFSQTKYAAGVGSGFDALTLSLRALNIGVGDEVIVPVNTFIATWLAVTHVGAVPVPVDADPLSGNIDVDKIAGVISTRTKAIIPVHLYGLSCEMDKIAEIARASDLKIIEDNAQAHGATFNGQRTGSFGHCNATSFYPSKILGACGDGGAVTTNDTVIYNTVCKLRSYGSVEKHHHEVLGVNSRLDELQAAVLDLKMQHLDKWINERRGMAAFYIDALTGVGDIVLPYSSPRCRHVFHLFVVRTKRRDDLKKFLDVSGIETAIHYPMPPYLQPAYAALGYKQGDFPVSEDLSRTSLSLPLWIGMRAEELEEVTRAIRDFYSRA